MGNYTGQLGRQRNQECFFTLVITPCFLLLNDKNPEYFSMVNNGYTQE
jgi:hypothetical protein